MHDHDNCRFYNRVKDFTVEDLAAFHGHLGSYLVVGYRIGRYVRAHFCNDPFLLHATICCSAKPPESCIADGVQIGSGCTLGKRNIEVVQSSDLHCEFEANGKKLHVVPRPEIVRASGVSSEADAERFAEEIARLQDDRIFDVYNL